jgi:hypothetical protein
MKDRKKLYGVYLKFLQSSLVFPNIERVLQPIGEGIERGILDTSTYDWAGFNEYQANVIMEEETDVVENLLGTAFVVCQTFISTVFSRICVLQSYYKKEHDGNNLSTTSVNKNDIMLFGSLKVMNTDFSEVQVIDAFANYFKHRDGWIGDWNKLSKRKGGITAQVISAVGASRGATGNLRTGAKVLGNETYSNVIVFANILNKWRQVLHNSYQEELELKQLL